jgi:Rieske Fe-S protein
MHQPFRQQLTRRDLIKTILVTSATSLIDNKLWAAKAISEVTPGVAADANVGIARVSLALYPGLNNNGGSVRLGSSGISGSFPVGLYYPILINRVSATEYAVLDTACTHEGCVVPAFAGSVASGRITCPCHGSQYDIHGNVTQGPAGSNLLTYASTLDSVNRILSITFPDQVFNTRQTSVLNGTEKRLEIKWSSFAGVEYELRYRPNFQTEPVRVPFSTTISGVIGATTITGNNTSETATNAKKLYVVPQDGFYQIAIKLTQR